jgi:dihydrofolate synthase/folylpolyglutamate synthase
VASRHPVFLIDGGHNPQCARSVTDSLLHYFPSQRRILLTGVLADKDYPRFFDILNEAADAYVCITPDSGRALPAEALAEHLRRFGKPVTACGSIREGLETALAQAEPDAMVCAVGSLYMAGELRACFGLC